MYAIDPFPSGATKIQDTNRQKPEFGTIQNFTSDHPFLIKDCNEDVKENEFKGLPSLPTPEGDHVEFLGFDLLLFNVFNAKLDQLT